MEKDLYKGKFKFGEPKGYGVVYIEKDGFRGKIEFIIDRYQ